MNKYTDAIKLNCEQYINKYPGEHKTYDRITVWIATTMGLISGFLMGTFL